MNFIPLTFLAAIFLGVGTEQTEDQKKLMVLIQKMVAAQERYEPDQIEKLTTTDYIEVSPIGELDPRKKMLGFYDPKKKPPTGKTNISSKATDFHFRIYKDFSIIIATLNFEVTTGGKTYPPRQVRTTYVCRKVDGKWKIASAQYTGIKPKTKRK